MVGKNSSKQWDKDGLAAKFLTILVKLKTIRMYLLVSRLRSPLCGVPNRLTSNLHFHPPLGDWHPCRHRAAAPLKPPNSRSPHPTAQSKGERYGRLSQLPREASPPQTPITPTLKGRYCPGAECQHEGQCPDFANTTQLCKWCSRNYPQYMFAYPA